MRWKCETWIFEYGYADVVRQRTWVIRFHKDGAACTTSITFTNVQWELWKWDSGAPVSRVLVHCIRFYEDCGAARPYAKYFFLGSPLWVVQVRSLVHLCHESWFVGIRSNKDCTACIPSIFFRLSKLSCVSEILAYPCHKTWFRVTDSTKIARNTWCSFLRMSSVSCTSEILVHPCHESWLIVLDSTKIARSVHQFFTDVQCELCEWDPWCTRVMSSA